MEAVRRLSRLAVVVLVAVSALAAVAGAKVEDYVPADALGIIKVQDPVAQYDKLQSSALVQRLEDPSFMPELAAKISDARTGIQNFEAQMGVNVHDALSDLLGREAVLVVLPGNQGVVIVEGRDADSLQKGVDAFLSVQRAVGDLTGETTSTYKDVTVHRGLVKRGEQYYAVSGNVLAAGQQLAAVQKVIDVVKGGPSLGASAAYRSASGMTAKGAPITGYLSGQVLQPLVEKLSAAPAAGQSQPLQRMLRSRVAEIASAVQYAALSVSGEKGLQVQLTLVYKDGRIPEALQCSLPEPGSRLDAMKLAPKTAAAVAARGINFQAAWDSQVKAVGAYDPALAQTLQTGLDRLVGMVGGVQSREEFFAELGSQVALVVMPAPDQKGLPEAALALQLRQTTNIPNALNTFVAMAVMGLQQQGKGVSLDRSEYNGAHLTTVHTEANGPLGKLSPTFGVVGDYLVVATTQDAIHSIVDAARTNPAPAINKPGTPVGVVTISAPQVQALVRQYHDFLVQQSVKNEGKTMEQAQHDTQALEQVLSLLQTVQITSTFEPGRTNHYLTVELAGSRP